MKIDQNNLEIFTKTDLFKYGIRFSVVFYQSVICQVAYLPNPVEMSTWVAKLQIQTNYQLLTKPTTIIDLQASWGNSICFLMLSLLLLDMKPIRNVFKCPLDPFSMTNDRTKVEQIAGFQMRVTSFKENINAPFRMEQLNLVDKKYSMLSNRRYCSLNKLLESKLLVFQSN